MLSEYLKSWKLNACTPIWVNFYLTTEFSELNLKRSNFRLHTKPLVILKALFTTNMNHGLFINCYIHINDQVADLFIKTKLLQPLVFMPENIHKNINFIKACTITLSNRNCPIFHNSLHHVNAKNVRQTHINALIA